VGGFLSHSGRLREEKILAPSESRLLDCLAHYTVTIQTVPSHHLPLKVTHGYIHIVPAEMY